MICCQAARLLTVIAPWCGRRDLNPHGRSHQNLNLACLPIPPRPPMEQFALQANSSPEFGSYRTCNARYAKTIAAARFRARPTDCIERHVYRQVRTKINQELPSRAIRPFCRGCWTIKLCRSNESPMKKGRAEPGLLEIGPRSLLLGGTDLFVRHMCRR